MQHFPATQTHSQDQIALHDGLESGVDATGLLAHGDQIALHDGLESGVVADAEDKQRRHGCGGALHENLEKLVT